MAGYRPGPEVHRDPHDSPGQPRDPHRRRRTLGPYGPREETGPQAGPQAGPAYDPPGYGRPPNGGSRPAGQAADPPWGQPPRPAGGQPWRQQPRRAPARPDPTGGAEGNERLTAATGAVMPIFPAASAR